MSKKISAFDQEKGALRDNDLLALVDAYDTTEGPAGTTKNSRISRVSFGRGSAAEMAAPYLDKDALRSDLGNVATGAVCRDAGHGRWVRRSGGGALADNGGTILTAGGFGVSSSDYFERLPDRGAVIDVQDFGAAGDLSTNDTDACQAASDECTRLAALGVHPTLLLPEADGYLIDTLTVGPGVNVEQRAVIKSANTTGVVLDINGITLSNINEGNVYSGLWVESTQDEAGVTAAWGNTETNIGIRISAASWSEITHKACHGFAIGMQLRGLGAFAHATVRLGEFRDCKRCLDLFATTGGWVNENLFLGGSFRGVQYTSLRPTDRIGIRVRADGGAVGDPNGNTFVKPSLELGEPTPYPADPLDEVCTPVHISDGTTNRFIAYRNEANGNLLALCDGTSRSNVFEADYDDNAGQVVYESGSGSYGNVQVGGTWKTPTKDMALLGRYELSDRYVPEGDAGCSFRGMGILSNVSGQEPIRVSPGFTDDGISVTPDSSNYGVGVMIDTSVQKSFLAVRDTDGAGSSAWIAVRAYDAANNDITDTAVFGRQMTYNGSVLSGKAQIFVAEQGFFRVTDDVVRVFVCVTRNEPFVALSIYAPTWRPRTRLWAGDGVWPDGDRWVGVREGDGSPESVLDGALGSLYSDRTNGILYVKESGTGNTGWSNKALTTLPQSNVAGLPAAGSSNTGQLRYVTNGAAGNPCVACSDGTNWLVVVDLSSAATVSAT